MKLTIAEASRQIRLLNSKKAGIEIKEGNARTFIAATTEDIETVRPKYDYEQTQEEIADIDKKVREIKHALAVFNTSTVVPGFEDMTVDQILIYIPQLNKQLEKLDLMRGQPAKQRKINSHSGNIIDYEYANFDTEKVAADYAALAELIAKAQSAIDIINNTETIEVE